MHYVKLSATIFFFKSRPVYTTSGFFILLSKLLGNARVTWCVGQPLPGKKKKLSSRVTLPY